MKNHLSYYIDHYEIRLKGARAARDWEEVDNIFQELQKLYSMDKACVASPLTA